MGAREIRSGLMDIDGVLVHEELAIPRAEFRARLCERATPFLVLTNRPIARLLGGSPVLNWRPVAS